MEVVVLGFVALFVLVFIGVPLGFGLMLVGLGGFAVVRGIEPGLAMAGQQILDISTNFGFSVLPLFILMGAFVHRAGLSDELYDATNAWLGHRRGGLAMATVAACGGFAAVSGSSLATAATMAKVAMPAMRKHGYQDSLAAGSVAAGGTLGILIPPSVPMVIYGILTETDIGKLFIAGLLPGILLTVLFILSISVATWIKPEIGPPGEKKSWSERGRVLTRVWGIIALFALVLGGIFFGFFTPTEAAGVGAMGAFLFALARRALGWKELFESLVDAGRTTGMIFVVAFGALIFSQFVSLAGLADFLVTSIQSLDVSVITVILVMCAILLVLGCVFDSLAMLLLTVPIFVPIIEPLGVDLIWFGIVMIIVVEMGLITPPIGMNVFVVKSAIFDVDLWAIYRGVWPFILAMIVCLVLIMMIPQIATWLPSFVK
ncbi:MAG: TRAP transporter large permease [Proteobacteria bacterium]|nr:TRAP transporter large permease [Pseudomonadota bacterium]